MGGSIKMEEIEKMIRKMATQIAMEERNREAEKEIEENLAAIGIKAIVKIETEIIDIDYDKLKKAGIQEELKTASLGDLTFTLNDNGEKNNG